MRRLTAFMPAVSLEAEQPVATPMLPVDVDTPSSDMVEPMFDELEQRQDNIVRASRIAATLEDLANNLQDTIATGDVRPSTLVSTAIATDHLIEDAGLELPPALSAEDMREPESRLKAATVAMEDIRDKVKRIWEAILRGLSKLCDFIDIAYNKLFGESALAVRRASKLLARVKHHREAGTAASVPTLDKMPYFPQLFVEKTFVEPKDLEYVIKLLSDTFPAQEAVTKQVEQIIDLLRDGRASEIKNMSAGFKHPMMGLAQGEYRTAYLMLGGEVMYATPIAAGGVTPGALKSYTAGVSTQPGEEPRYSEKTVPVADLQKLSEFAAAALHMASSVGSANTFYSRSRSVKRKFLSDLKRMSLTPAVADNETDETVAYAKALVENSLDLIDNPLLSLARYVLALTHRLMQYIEDCLKLYDRAPGAAA